MNRKVLKVKGTKKIFKETGIRTYIVQKEDGAIKISQYKAERNPSEEHLSLNAPVMLSGSSGFLILGPKTALQYYGTTSITKDLLSLYKQYTQRGLSVFKDILGGYLFSVIVNPILEDAVSGKGVNFSTLLTTAVPTKIHHIENLGRYTLDIYSILMDKETYTLDASSSTEEEGSPTILKEEEESQESISSSSDWRQKPITDRQRNKLKELGLQVDPSWKYGEASDHIAQANKKGPAATDRQIKLLSSFGVSIPQGLTQREASKLIVEEKRKRGLNRS